MKKIFTLAAGTALVAAASLNAQAQIVVDGTLSAAEISATGYQLVGRDTGARPAGFGDAGVLSLYAAATPTRVFFFLAGTLQNGSGGVSNALQLYIGRPGVTGAAASPSALPAPTPPTGTALATSFANMTAKMDFAVDMGVGIKGNGTANQVNLEGIRYTSSTAATAAVISAAPLEAGTGVMGTASPTVAVGPLAPFLNAMAAYRSAADLSSNPGFASVGGAGSFGLEISLDRTALGISTGNVLRIFALQNNQDGGYLSSDYIPQNTAPLPASFTQSNGNLEGGPDFALVPGAQVASVQVNAASAVVLASRNVVAAAAGLTVAPNPIAGAATVSYRVAEAGQNVTIVLTDLLGRPVRTLAQGIQTVGAQSAQINTANLAAGAYLVRVEMGTKVAVSKVVVL